MKRKAHCYFDAATIGFYFADIHGAARLAGLHPLTKAEYEKLLKGQAAGNTIAADADGQPTLVDRPPLPDEQRIELRRAARDRKLAASDWTQLPDAFGGDEARKARWAEYRQELRDLDMANDGWPANPEGKA